MQPADLGHCLKAEGGKRFLRQQRSSSRDRCQLADGDRAGLPDTWCFDRNVTPISLFCSAGGQKHCVMPHGGMLAMACRISFLQAAVGCLMVFRKREKTALPGTLWFFPALSGHVENRRHFPSYSRLGSFPGLQLVVLKQARTEHSQTPYRCRDRNSQPVQTVIDNFQLRWPTTISLGEIK